MRRPFVLVLTLIALLWHGMAGASLHVWADMAEGAEHAGLHWTETSHHHDHDGDEGIELDDSSASLAHMVLDGTAPTLLAFETLDVPRIPLSHGQPGYLAPPLTAPVLLPLQKPPRF